MNDVIIKVENLNKTFKLYNHPKDRLKEALSPFRKKYHHEYHALKDISFEIKKGESTGILGKNGAGKSTLLKILTGVLTPTSGKVTVTGRISALLELGSGFNPELSGLENIFFQGAIIGFTRMEMERKLPEIVEFADIGEFIYQPVKTYSSGMFARLAFSISINVDPDVLIVDEALSVGDELFQRKCFSQIERMKKRGVAILLVSHSTSAIVEVCSRAILIQDGCLVKEGLSKKVVGYYQRLLNNSFVDGKDKKKAENDIDHCTDQVSYFDPGLISQSMISYHSNGANIANVKVINSENQRVNFLKKGEIYSYSYEVIFSDNATNVVCGMLIKTVSGIELGGATNAGDSSKKIASVRAGEKIRVNFLFTCSLNPGSYFFNAGVRGSINGEEVYLHRILDAVIVKVLPSENSSSTGYIDFNCSFSLY